MREIKFRAWDVHEKKMSPVANVMFGDDGGALTICFYAAPAEKYPHMLVHGESGILLEFTGLKDKNGKEIYEGDIVRGIVELPHLLISDTDDNSNFKMCGEVFYDHTGFSLRVVQHLSDSERLGMVNYFDFVGKGGEVFTDLEVIGNICENPELLK